MVNHAFVKATYKLKGDGPLAFECYETVECVSRSVELAHALNVEAVSTPVIACLMAHKLLNKGFLIMPSPVFSLFTATTDDS